LYLASGFAEGKSGANILASTMRARPYRGGWAISGKKQPCSLSASMDLLSASVTVVDGDRHARAVALVPADSPGIRIEPFWKSPILAGAESDSVILEDVFVPKDFVSFPQTEGALDPLEKLGYFWFWLLICASYTGIASALIDRVIREARGSAQDRAAMAAKIELCQAGLEGVAATAELGKPDVSSELPRLLLVRHELEEAIVQAASLAAGALGGMAFVGSGAVARLLASTRPLAMHPPGRATTIAALARFLEGESLELV
jgi:alkylation response protein AidB-like acyl-CoA dehydrogenase